MSELAFVALLVGYGPFSPFRLVLLLLVASASLWNRRIGWAGVGLRRPPHPAHTAAVAAMAILLAVPTVIVPFSNAVTGGHVDLSALGDLRESATLWALLAQVWTLAAFGEEMAFRAYLMQRIVDLVGASRAGWVAAAALSSVLFGLAHGYQGAAGIIATGLIGGLLALLYLHSRRNLWSVIMCHGFVDTVSLSLIYFGHESLLFPPGRAAP